MVLKSAFNTKKEQKEVWKCLNLSWNICRFEYQKDKKKGQLAGYPIFLFHLKPLQPASSSMNDSSKYVIREDNGKKSFAGTYHRVGAKLTHTENSQIQFIIGTRENPTRHKAKHFLLSFEGRNKPNLYFSSLYATIDPNRFEIEYAGVRYAVILDSDKAEMIVLLDQSLQAA